MAIVGTVPPPSLAYADSMRSWKFVAILTRPVGQSPSSMPSKRPPPGTASSCKTRPPASPRPSPPYRCPPPGIRHVDSNPPICLPNILPSLPGSVIVSIPLRLSRQTPPFASTSPGAIFVAVMLLQLALLCPKAHLRLAGGLWQDKIKDRSASIPP